MLLSVGNWGKRGDCVLPPASGVATLHPRDMVERGYRFRLLLILRGQTSTPSSSRCGGLSRRYEQASRPQIRKCDERPAFLEFSSFSRAPSSHPSFNCSRVFLRPWLPELLSCFGFEIALKRSMTGFPGLLGLRLLRTEVVCHRSCVCCPRVEGAVEAHAEITMCRAIEAIEKISVPDGFCCIIARGFHQPRRSRSRRGEGPGLLPDIQNFEQEDCGTPCRVGRSLPVLG